PLAAWLTHYTDWLRHAPYAPQANDEIQAAVTQALRLVDIPPRPEYAGHCTTCGQPVYAVHLRPGLPRRRPRRPRPLPDPHPASPSTSAPACPPAAPAPPAPSPTPPRRASTGSAPSTTPS